MKKDSKWSTAFVDLGLFILVFCAIISAIAKFCDKFMAAIDWIINVLPI